MSQTDSDKALVVPVPLERNPAAVYLASLASKHSRRVMAHGLRTIAALLTAEDGAASEDRIFSLEWGALRYAHTAAIRVRLLERYTPASVNRMLSALRGVLKEAWRLGYMSAEDYARACDIKSVRGETLPAGRELSGGEIMALVNACKADKIRALGFRDIAMLGVLYTCGVRRAELVALDVSDFDPDSGKLSIRAGKGRKARTVYAQGGTLFALRDWLNARGDSAGALFIPIQKNGKLVSRRLNAQTVYDMLKRRAVQAGVRDFSPHDLRRTFVGDMLDSGVDIATVANIAGHASIDTTRRYDRRPDETKKRAAEKLHFPY
jgi:integrase